jgi:hypothetical protein
MMPDLCLYLYTTVEFFLLNEMKSNDGAGQTSAFRARLEALADGIVWILVKQINSPYSTARRNQEEASRLFIFLALMPGAGAKL